MQNLSIVRGTSFPFSVKLTDALGDRLKMDEGDKLYFGVKRFPEHKKYQILKTLYLTSDNRTENKLNADDYNEDIGGYIFEIKPEDTQDFVFDKYYYDVGLETNEGDFFSVIECSILEIRPGITAKM